MSGFLLRILVILVPAAIMVHLIRSALPERSHSLAATGVKGQIMSRTTLRNLSFFLLVALVFYVAGSGGM